MTSPITSAGIGAISPLPEMSKLELPSAGEGGGFSGVLTNALNQVNQLSSNATDQISNVLHGGGADISSVMVAVEKADVAFQLMMQVRNKIVNAYSDVEKMQF